MASEQRVCCLLPVELWSLIIGKLDIPSAVSLSSTSKHMSKLIKLLGDDLWRGLYQSSFGIKPHSTAILVYGSFRSACISRDRMGDDFRNSYDSLLSIFDTIDDRCPNSELGMEIDASSTTHQLMKMVFKIWFLSQEQPKQIYSQHARSQIVNLMMPSLCRYLFIYYDRLIISFIDDALRCVETYDPWAGGFYQYVEVPWMRSAMQALVTYATISTGIAGDYLILREALKANNVKDSAWSGIPSGTIQRLNILDNAIKSAAEEAEDLCGDIAVPKTIPRCHWWWFVSSISPNAC